MYDVRMNRSLTLTMIMLLSALSPILMPVSADHDGNGTGANNSGEDIFLSIFDNDTSSWELLEEDSEDNEFPEMNFLEEGTHQLEIRSTNLTLNESYTLEWSVYQNDLLDEDSESNENRSWIAYNNESAESFNITVDEMTCEIGIAVSLSESGTQTEVDWGVYWLVGACGNNGVITTNIEIDGNSTEVESFFSENGFDNTIELEAGVYDMWWSKSGQTFTNGSDYLIEWYRGVSGQFSEDETEGMYEWTAGSGQGQGLSSQGWNITVQDDTCEVWNDAILYEAEYFANGTWDKDNSTIMGTTITMMLGPCEEPDLPHVELYYDNGTGPVMYEMHWEYEEFDYCEDYEEEGQTWWECEVDYDGDGMADDIIEFENCELDNNSMTYFCEVYPEVPYLEPGNYEFMANISNLEIGEDYEVYANYYLNTQNNYDSANEWFSWNNSNESQIIDGLELDINEYMCSLHLQYDIYMDGNHIMHGEFSFDGDCDEMPEMPSPFELYYDNGTGPVMWEPVWNYEEFDSCYENESYWECSIDYDNDGNTDWINHYENCEFDNNSTTYWCAVWYDDPMLEPGNYTFTLNVSGLEIGELHELQSWFNGNYEYMSFNATDEYEHFEWNIDIDEYMCGFGMEFHLAHYNGMHFHNYFHFKGLCEEMPSPFELYYDNGTGPVMWEPVYNYAAYDDCYEYDDGYWECEIDYDGDGMTDDYYGFEHCEWDNNSTTYLCEMGWNNPMLEPGNYTFTLNVSGLEIGELHELQSWFNGNYEYMSFNATDEYEHFEWNIDIDEYMCGFGMEFHLAHYNGMHFHNYFPFNTYCEEPVSDHFFELYYDNGTEVMKWEPTITLEEFDNCYENEEGNWECEIDYDGDGYIDDYAKFRDCMWDNSSATYLCEVHQMPMLEPGYYTLILNATMLVIDTDYKLDWRLNFEGFDYTSEEMNASWTASEEYEHFEWDIEVDESMCMLHSDLEVRTEDANNSTYGFAHFGFNGLCEEPPQPLELYFNDMLYTQDMMMEESNAPHLEAGANYMSWSMLGLEVGDEYNLSWSVSQMGMFDDDMDEEDVVTHIFAANNEEMMHDWEVEIENDTCMVMITGVLINNGSDDVWSGMLGIVWAMFMGPCEIEMGDVGLDMLNPDDGDWYEMDGMNGSDTLGMMMFTDSEEDEMNMMMSILENNGTELETGNYTMRWVFEDLEVGEEYMVFMEDLMLDMDDDEPEFVYHNNCSEEYNEEDDEYYWLCYVENDDGSIDYLSYEYCYEYDDGYDCEVYDNMEDLLTTFNASSDSEYYEWELTITDDTCGHVFLIGIMDAENGEDGFPIALSMYAIAGPNMSNCFGHYDNGPSPEDWMWMTDMDGDGNMSWDEFSTFMENEDSVDNETMELMYQFFTESDWNGDGTLDMEELSYFLPKMMSLEDDDNDGPSPEDLMMMTDMDGDGNMSWDEFSTFMENEDSVDNETMELMYQFFTESDWNGDGTLDMEELSYFIPMIMSLDDDNDGNGPEDWSENLMYMADYNENGHIDWEEFYEFMYINMDGENITNETWSYWNEQFENADMDSDGQLNMTELNDFWYRVNGDFGDNNGPGDNDGPSPEDLMMMTDMDGDGNMSWDEFSTFMENEDSVDNETMELMYQFFTESDWNGDGTLDMEELSYFIPMIMSLDDDNDGIGPEDLMYMADYNENGHIDWEEFYEFMYINMDGENITNETWSYWNEQFENADMDSDGQLNMTELNDFWYRVNDDSGDDWDLTDFALGQDWTVSLGYTDTVNFTFYLGATQILADDFRANADMAIGDGDGYLNTTEAEQVYFWLIDNLDTEPEAPENITLNDVPAEVIFKGYEIMDLSSDSAYNPVIITTWDVMFHDVESDSDGNYKFAYMENSNDAGVDAPANFCAWSYEYSYQIIEFVWNGTSIDYINADGEIGCVSLDIGEVVPSFSITYGQEVNMDYDNDGVNNEDDAFPYDPSETMDTDGDGWGDNSDAFPDDNSEWIDTDGDGVGDNADTDYNGDGTDDSMQDTDGDGVNDELDDFPNDANESIDTDGDGVGDNSDAFPNNASESSDLDGDGVGDNSDDDADGDGTPNDVDAFPLTDSSNDDDNDGVSNDLDHFPNDSSEYFDSDGDGVGDNADLDDDGDGVADSVDAFPYDPSETMDTDGDGLGDNADEFPNDATEKVDSDGDGVGDNSDLFPSDTTEWGDTDGDGVGDNSDAFPNDATEIVDSDGDGVGNNADAFPYDANEQKDSDGNGVGDNAQDEQNNGGTNPPGVVDPVEDDGGFLPGFSAIMGIISMLGAAVLVAGRRKD